MFPYQTTSSPFNFRIHRLSTSLQIVLPHTNSLVISDRSSSYTTSVLAYRPNFANDTTAVFFINLEAIFPCYRTISNDNQIPPVCQLFSYSDMSPPSGRPYIEASDIGNNFHIFSGSQNIAIYGFGIMGYSQVVGAGWNYRVELTLVCLLPPACSLN